MRAQPTAIILSVLAGLAASQPVAARKFGCESMPAGATQSINETLDQAQTELNSGNYESAAELTAIGSSIIRFGAGDQYVDFECAGKAVRTRVFRLRQKAYRPWGQAEEQKAQNNAAVRYRVADKYLMGRNLDDVKRVLNNPSNPKLVAQAGPALRKYIERMNYSVENGHGLIPEETETLAVYTDQLDKLVKESSAKAAALLQQEEQTVNGPASELQTTVDDTMTMTEAVTGSFLGVDGAMPGDRETRMIVFRASQSAVQLSEGRAWVDWIAPAAPAALKSRAIKRGDTLVARATDTKQELEVRDQYYDAAIGYFKLADAEQKMASAQAAREAFQPALEAQRAERDQKMEQRVDELKQSAEEFKRSMEKTPEEKESFKSEVDSLEGELGF